MGEEDPDRRVSEMGSVHGGEEISSMAEWEMRMVGCFFSCRWVLVGGKRKGKRRHVNVSLRRVLRYFQVQSLFFLKFRDR